MLTLFNVENKIKDLTEIMHNFIIKNTIHRKLWTIKN
jgi:hypothetical protein